MLGGIRVLEDSCEETMYAGTLLAELGADVVVMEPPSGSQARRLGPFVEGMPSLESGIPWRALNCAKRSVTTKANSPDGMALALRLIERSDVILTGGSSQLVQKAIPALPDRVIHCDMVPFSRVGTKSHYKATDLIIMAASGAPGSTGEPDRPPVFFPFQQAVMEAGADAAVAVVAALLARDRDSIGQHLEVDERVAAMASAHEQQLFVRNGATPPPRGEERPWAWVGDIEMPRIFECTDGFCELSCAFGSPGFSPKISALVECLVAHGHARPELKAVDWVSFKSDGDEGRVSLDPMRELISATTSFCKERSKLDIDDCAKKFGFLSAPIFDMSDVLAFNSFNERGLWMDVAEESGPLSRQPSRFAHFSNGSIRTGRSPRLSEHTVSVLMDDLELSLSEVQALFAHGII